MRKQSLSLALITALVLVDASSANAGPRAFFSRIRSFFSWRSKPAVTATIARKSAPVSMPTAPSQTRLRAQIARSAAPALVKPLIVRRWQRDLEDHRRDVNRGGRGSVFLRHNLLGEVAQRSRKLFDFDRAGGARNFTDPKSKFVLVEAFDNTPRTPHHLTIATGVKFQPTHLFDVPAWEAATVGGMVRLALGSHRYAGAFQNWIASVSLPGKLTIPILHVHGEPHVHAGFGETRPTAAVKDWDAYARSKGYRQVEVDENAGYRMYVPGSKGAVDHWKVIVVATDASIVPAKLTAAHDELLGRMYLDGARQLLSKVERGPFGYIEVARNDKQLVVRVVAD
jgi:hypothetical protein